MTGLPWISQSVTSFVYAILTNNARPSMTWDWYNGTTFGNITLHCSEQPLYVCLVGPCTSYLVTLCRSRCTMPTHCRLIVVTGLCGCGRGAYGRSCCAQALDHWSGPVPYCCCQRWMRPARVLFAASLVLPLSDCAQGTSPSRPCRSTMSRTPSRLTPLPQAGVPSSWRCDFARRRQARR